MSARPKVVVIGAGAFGTALATVVSLEGKAEVTLLGRDAALMVDLANDGVHEAALPGILLPDLLNYSAEPEVLQEADIVLMAVPSQSHADAALQYGPYLPPTASVVTCAKGIDRTSTRLLTEVLEQAMPNHDISVLSGPGFASDIARGLPTAMVLAASDAAKADYLARTLSGRTFRLYASTDLVGVQLGGALKNVLAIACGIVEGMGLGESARAALIARGLAEMSRFVVAKGGLSDTVAGLSGLGDLVLTATSHQSRNLRFGIALGHGESMDFSAGTLVEGAFTAAVASRLAEGMSVEMPITDAVATVIDGRVDIPTVIEQLMSRPITTE